MKKIILTLSFIIVVTIGFSQVLPDTTKQQTYYYTKPADIETTDLKIEFLETVSQVTFTKVKVKITNKTNDFIIFKLSETKFVSSKGEYGVEGKDLIIAPMSDETKSLMVKGASGLNEHQLTMRLNGFSKVPTLGAGTREVASANNFDLSSINKEFAIDSFHCKLLGMKKSGDTLEAFFKCIYKGENNGILNTSNIVLVTANGQEYSNLDSKLRPRIIGSGRKENFKVKFILPVQEINTDSLSIAWKATFTESSATTLTGNSTFELNLKAD